MQSNALESFDLQFTKLCYALNIYNAKTVHGILHVYESIEHNKIEHTIFFSLELIILSFMSFAHDIEKFAHSFKSHFRSFIQFINRLKSIIEYDA